MVGLGRSEKTQRTATTLSIEKRTAAVHSTGVPARRFVIIGLVQGVFFRAQAKEKANELGLMGFVKNLNDGGVEIHAEGPEVKLKEFEKWCHKGPPGAVVENVTATFTSEKPYASFEIVP